MHLLQELQSVINIPMWLRSNDAAALEKALRIYNGKAMISAADKSLSTLLTLLPAAKKYGAVIALTDEEMAAIDTLSDAGIDPADILLVNDDTVEFV